MILDERTYLNDVVKWENENHRFSREAVTVLSGESLSLAQVLGKITNATPTVGTADAGNTGDGLMASVTAGDSVQIGTYTMTCTGVTAGAITTPVTGTADGGNTGDGTMTGATAGTSAEAGTYTLTCTAAAANSGTFAVAAPSGDALPDATVAVAYTNAQLNFTINDGAADFIVGDVFTIVASAADGNSGTFSVAAPDGKNLADATVAVAYTSTDINFTIADGATDFIVGDIFTVAVAEGSGKVVEIEFAATDGSQKAHGILIADVDASAADVKGTAIVLQAIIVASYLVWPAGATTAQKAAALVELAAKDIVTRTEA